MVTSLSETDKAYLACFVDTDGCVNIAGMHVRYASKRHKLQLVFTNKEREVLDYFQGLTHLGKVSREKKNGEPVDVWSWRIGDASAEVLLRAIQPYVHIKSVQVEIALKFRDTYRDSGNGTPLDPKLVLQRDYYRVALSRAKGRKRTPPLKHYE